MCNMQLPQATACVYFLKNKTNPHPLLLIGRGRDIWIWMSAHMESQPLPTHLTQYDSCVMIWGVWTSVCLASPRRWVLSWVRGAERGTRQEGTVSFFILATHSPSCAGMWEINKQTLLQWWGKVEVKILINDGCLQRSLRKSAFPANIRNHRDSSNRDGTSLQVKTKLMVIVAWTPYIMTQIPLF